VHVGIDMVEGEIAEGKLDLPFLGLHELVAWANLYHIVSFYVEDHFFLHLHMFFSHLHNFHISKNALI